MSIATAAGIIAQTPAGGLIDATRAKRAVMAVAAIAVTAASLLLPLVSRFIPVAASQATAHAAAAVFGPGASGRVARNCRARRLHPADRPQRDRSITPAMPSPPPPRARRAYLWGPTVVFYLLAAMSAASLVSILIIPGPRHRQRAGPWAARRLDGRGNPVADGDTPAACACCSPAGRC